MKNWCVLQKKEKKKKSQRRVLREKNKKKKTQKTKELHRKIEEMRSMLKALADKPNVCMSDSRYQEMFSFMTEGNEGHEEKDGRRVDSKQGRSLRC